MVSEVDKFMDQTWNWQYLPSLTYSLEVCTTNQVLRFVIVVVVIVVVIMSIMWAGCRGECVRILLAPVVTCIVSLEPTSRLKMLHVIFLCVMFGVWQVV